MSKTILQIGYSAFLLPSDQGLATVLKALKGALRITAIEYLGDGAYSYTLDDEADVEIRHVTRKTRFVTKDGIAVDVTAKGDKPKPAKAIAAGSRRALPAPQPRQLFLGERA